MKSNGFINYAIRFSCFIGLCLSYYAYFVETRMERDNTYTPMCDINSHMSCSRAFLSEYGKAFGLGKTVLSSESIFNQPNGLIGCIFYSLYFVLSFIDRSTVIIFLLVLAWLSNIVSAYLAAVLYFVLLDACLVCISTYVVNLAILLLTYRKLYEHKGKNIKLF